MTSAARSRQRWRAGSRKCPELLSAIALELRALTRSGSPVLKPRCRLNLEDEFLAAAAHDDRRRLARLDVAGRRIQVH